MRISSDLADNLPLQEAARKTISSSLLQIPHLISERSLENAVDQLAAQTRARAKHGFTPVLEMISMPKSGYGPRPISILSAEARTLYEALGERLKGYLSAPSRDKGLSAHEEFGATDSSPSSTQTLVDFDIAACYEYINHEILAEELLVQTLDADAIEALQALLLEVFSRGVGIPQAMETSHILADAYLGKIERSIIRAGYPMSRFADDFRIITNSWGEAYKAIETSVDLARKSGLVLAEGKTNIRSARRVKREIEERENVLQRYKDQAQDELQSIDLIRVGYEDFAVNEVEPDQEEVDFAALAQIVQDWAADDFRQEPRRRTALASLGSRALQVLQGAPSRVANSVLVDIVERQPIRLYAVVSYLAGRSESDDNWAALRKLVELPRQSPWAQLWMLHLADSLDTGGQLNEGAVLTWADSLLNDRHEVVRAEAAWLLSGYGKVSISQIGDLYVGASDITRTGLSACAGRLEKGSLSKESRAMKGDSALNIAAYEWAAADAH